MFVSDIVKLINQKLAGDTVPMANMILFMDEVMDEVNAELNSIFPTFTEYMTLIDPTGDYRLIPDKYLRTVFVYGSAFKFYSTDEEGVDSATGYQMKYEEHRFYMVRDFINSVPDEYKADPTGYYAPNPGMSRGLWVSPFALDDSIGISDGVTPDPTPSPSPDPTPSTRYMLTEDYAMPNGTGVVNKSKEAQVATNALQLDGKASLLYMLKEEYASVTPGKVLAAEQSDNSAALGAYSAASYLRKTEIQSVKVGLSAAQSITTTTATAILYNTILFNDAGAVLTGGGIQLTQDYSKCIINAGVQLSSGLSTFRLIKNGTLIRSVALPGAATNAATAYSLVEILTDLTSGDVFTATAQVAATTTLPVSVTAGINTNIELLLFK